MKRSFAIAAVLTAALSACGTSIEGVQPRLTQKIVTDGALDGSKKPENPEKLPDTAPSAEEPPSPAEELNLYYQMKAEQDAIEIEKENLESAYRIGKVAEESFRAKKEELERRDEELDKLKKPLKPIHAHIPPAETTLERLLQQLEKLERQENSLDSEEDNLEEAFRSGKMDRETFILNQADLLYREDLLDAQKHGCEDALELLGWDD